MNPLALSTMIVVCGFIWGSFIALLVRAWFREAKKADPGER